MHYKYIVLGFITSLVGYYVYDSAFKSKKDQNGSESHQDETVFDNESLLGQNNQ